MIFEDIEIGQQIRANTLMGNDFGVCTFNHDETASFSMERGGDLSINRQSFKQTVKGFNVEFLDKNHPDYKQTLPPGIDAMLNFGTMLENSATEDGDIDDNAMMGNMMSAMGSLMSGGAPQFTPNPKKKVKRLTKEENLEALSGFLNSKILMDKSLQDLNLEVKVNTSFMNGSMPMVNVAGHMSYVRTFFNIRVDDDNSEFTIGNRSSIGNEDFTFRLTDYDVVLDYLDYFLNMKVGTTFINYMYDNKKHGKILTYSINPHQI